VNKKVSAIIGLLILCSSGMSAFSAEIAGLPDPVPFAMPVKTARQNPVFTTGAFPWTGKDGKTTIYQQASFVVGNKAVCVRKVNGKDDPRFDHMISILIDNKEVGTIVFWGAYEKDMFGYPFPPIDDDPATILIDKEKQTITYRKPYFTPDCAKAVFTYTLRGLDDSRVELSWDVGVTSETIASVRSTYALNVYPWIGLKESYRQKKVVFGSDTLQPAPLAKISGKNTVVTVICGDLVYAADNPVEGYTLEMNGLDGQVTEATGYDGRLGITCRYGAVKNAPKGSIVIDLGEAGMSATDLPPVVGGIDFWKVDGTHVPLPAVRNRMPNPSFEQGMHYWRWVGGGAYYQPSDVLRYGIVKQGMFGQNALILRDTQPGSPSIKSFPISLENGETYTLSFYAKADRNCPLTVALASASHGGKFRGKYGVVFGDSWTPESTFNITTEWKRYSRTFVMDTGGVQVVVGGNSNTLLDGLQIEEGSEPTEFVAPTLDGEFITADPDNAIVKGQPIQGALRITGKAGAKGAVSIVVMNTFRETVAQQTIAVTLSDSGVSTFPVAIDEEKIGEGVFVVQATYTPDDEAGYVDYYRFSVMTPLENRHATKDVFGTILGNTHRINRGEDLARKLMEWGFGSTSWGIHYFDPAQGMIPHYTEQEKRYRFSNFFMTAMPVYGKDADLLAGYKDWKEITPELEKRIEEAAYNKVKSYDPDHFYSWCFGNEEESAYLPGNKMFDEYFKAQAATARGVKRANPKAIVSPTNGTSGYSRLRGYDAIEGYLAAAQRHGFKYDAVSVHPYGNTDKGRLSKNDLDEETARLIEQMKRYGYGEETPIYFTELFNIPETYIPQWGAGGAYDYYDAGKPTYDFGNREFIHAATAARIWIIVLKYWPRVKSTNIWCSMPFLDFNLTPLVLCKAANTLGHHLPDVSYIADIKPAANIRGYAFKLKTDDTGVSALWCIDRDVENGLRKGPVVQVKFGQPVEFYDLMGNRRDVVADSNGITAVQLTPAPLLIHAKDASKLATALQTIESDDCTTTLSISIPPAVDGHIKARVQNMTAREQSGVMEICDSRLSYTIQPEEVGMFEIPGQTQSVEFGKMYRWNQSYKLISSKGNVLEREWEMDYFYVPKTSGMPDWKTIPSINITNRYVNKSYKGSLPAGDQSALYKMAWDEENLYLHVEAKDDNFVLSPELWQKPKADQSLYLHDGCLEVYFDTGADGRTNHEKTYDNNDYRYDFSIGKNGQSGPGMVYRLREVYHQLADGVNMASKEEAAKMIKCDFERTEGGYAYTIVFGKRYLEPIVLRKGFVSGFALYLHDKDNADEVGCPKGLSLASEPGSHCDYKPFLWPLMILSE